MNYAEMIAAAVEENDARFRFYYKRNDGETNLYWVRGIVNQNDFIVAEKVDQQGFPEGIRRFNKANFVTQPTRLKQ
jgi:hypothetical protein